MLESVKDLNETISSNLETLLTGINPIGLRETSNKLNEIMGTMNKSIQSMNLEKIISELKFMKAGGVYAMEAAPMVGQAAASAAPAEEINAGLKPPPGLKAPGGGGAAAPVSQQAATAEEWVDPTENRKAQDDDDDESRLLKPSDFFGM